MTENCDAFTALITVTIICLAFAVASIVAWTTHNDGVLFTFALCFIAITIFAAHGAIKKAGAGI